LEFIQFVGSRDPQVMENIIAFVDRSNANAIAVRSAAEYIVNSLKEIDTISQLKKTVVGMGKLIQAQKQEIAAAMGAGTKSATLYSADTVELIDPTALVKL
jgi:hypothetical protein